MSPESDDTTTKPLLVRRVFNNSAVLAVDVDGSERVLLGRGIGFHLHANDEVDASLIDKTFVLTGDDVSRYSALLAELSAEEIELARDVVVEARSALGPHVDAHVFLPLVDHINFAVRRAREDAKPIDYELRWEVQHLYPDEVSFAHRIITLISERLGVQVPAQEAIPLSLHFVNARVAASDMGSTIKTTRVLGKVLLVVKEEMGIDVDENSIDVARLVAHLRYLSSGKGIFTLAPVPESVVRAIREAQQAEHMVAQKIAAMLSDELGSQVNEQEIAFLTLHITRLKVAAAERAAE